MSFPPGLSFLVFRTCAKCKLVDVLSAARQTWILTGKKICKPISSLYCSPDSLSRRSSTTSRRESSIKCLKRGPKGKDYLKGALLDYILLLHHRGTLPSLLVQCMESRHGSAEFFVGHVTWRRNLKSMRHAKQVKICA
jgi:hypothetical protein